MKLYQNSKSSLFLMELLFNLLLFCALVGCSLLFFIKSYNLSAETTTLQHATRATTSVAEVFESGDGTLSSLCAVYEHADLVDNILYIYLDEEYNPCTKNEIVYYMMVSHMDSAIDTISIDFYDADGILFYSIKAGCYSPSTLYSVKEASK